MITGSKNALSSKSSITDQISKINCTIYDSNIQFLWLKNCGKLENNQRCMQLLNESVNSNRYCR